MINDSASISKCTRNFLVFTFLGGEDEERATHRYSPTRYFILLVRGAARVIETPPFICRGDKRSLLTHVCVSKGVSTLCGRPFLAFSSGEGVTALRVSECAVSDEEKTVVLVCTLPSLDNASTVSIFQFSLQRKLTKKPP